MRTRLKSYVVAIFIGMLLRATLACAQDLLIVVNENVGVTQITETRLRDIFTGLKHAILTPAILGRIGKVRLGLEFGAVGF